MNEISESEARRLAVEHADHNQVEIPADFEWTLSRFNDGWLAALAPPNPLSEPDGYYYVVLDDKTVYLEIGSGPPTSYILKHSRTKSDLKVRVEGGYLEINPDGTVIRIEGIAET